jgi:hypothetical protein
MMKKGIIIPNNAGLVTTTLLAANGDLVHTLSVGRTAKLRKIMWSNNTGAAGTLQFGTVSGTPAFVGLMPLITCLNGFDGELNETELPVVEWKVWTNLAVVANARTGNITVQASVAGILVICEVEEIG